MMGKLAAWLIGKLGSPLFFALLMAAAYLLAYLNGHSDGRRQCAENALEAVQAQLGAYQAQLAKAEAASLAHLEQLSQAEKNHEQSTRLLRRSLAESQSVRADCRLNAGLVQQLTAARNAAARAAAGGTGAALPATGRP